MVFRSAAVLPLILVGCMTKADCLDRQIEYHEQLLADGGLVESCPPDADMVIAHFEGPPYAGAACLPTEYLDSMPDCTRIGTGSSYEKDRAICRAFDAFSDHVELLGRNLRVDASGNRGDWRVRFASPADTPDQKGILIILDSDPEITPRAILY